MISYFFSVKYCCVPVSNVIDDGDTKNNNNNMVQFLSANKPLSWDKGEN